jgi:L-alanine-DL-glutamate epimerase-like enolase superfamily enzyme
VIYVVDEDYETLHAVEVLHAALRGKALGVVLNKVVGKPGREFLRMYGQLGRVYVARFDERMVVHKSVGVPPYRTRSVATLEMAKAAMDLKKHLFRPGR